MNKTNKTPIEILRESLSDKKETQKKKMLLSEMIYGDDYGYEQQEDSPGYENEPEIGGEPVQDGGNEMKPIQGDLPSERTNDPEIMEILSNIRLAVIKGLAKLATKPETQEYSVLKKILQIVDKPVETQDK